MYNYAMSTKNLRRAASLAILLFSIILLGWGLWPFPKQVRSLSINLPSTAAALGNMASPQSELQVQASPEYEWLSGISETRRLRLEWPNRIHVGDSGFITLTLMTELSGEALNSNARDSSTQFEELQSPHISVIQARLDIAGIDSDPYGEILQPVRMGDPMIFEWHLRPHVEGTYPATIWLHILNIPQSGSDNLRQPLSAQVLEIESVKLLGMGGSEARLVGALGIMAGAFLGLSTWVTRPF